MDQPRHSFVLRILAILFSVALATTYIACRGGYGPDSSDPPSEEDPPGDPEMLSPTKSAPVRLEEDFILPGSKSRPLFMPGSKSNQTEPLRVFPGSKSEAVTPSFLPGSKSIIIGPLEPDEPDNEKKQKPKQKGNSK